MTTQSLSSLILLRLSLLFLLVLVLFVTKAQEEQQQVEPSSNSSSWPHYILLEITFDSAPQELSWRFENARSSETLLSKSFGSYDSEKADKRIKERLNILTDADLNGDPMNESVPREYRLVVYDKGGNGLCCSNGEGQYDIYWKGKLLFTEKAFGAMSEHFVSIEAADFVTTTTTTTSTTTIAVTSILTTISAASTTNSTESFGDSYITNNQPSNSSQPSIVQQQKPTTIPKPTLKPISPSAQISVDQDRWYCGLNWNWIENNCDQAIPCPRGDESVCPENYYCFASTPCTKAPTTSPSMNPSMMPSFTPSISPTKAPWSNSALLDFVYGINTGGSEGDEIGINLKPSSEINDSIQKFSTLQYHFFCGFSWHHADDSCNKFCSSGDRSECDNGMECFANTRCDGRDTNPPTISPAPSGESVPTSSAGMSSEWRGDTCSVCRYNKLDKMINITVNNKSATCGDIESMLVHERILLGSDQCNAVQETYNDICCYDECNLCETSSGKFLDIKNRLIKKGGYSATCVEVNDILTSIAKEDKLCHDAQMQLALDCCYDHCTLCSDSPDITTLWYAAIEFEGIQSTCLGLDYMLRTDQISVTSDSCNSVRNTYRPICCHLTPSNPCQLCKVDDILYGVNTSKSVKIEETSSSSCGWINLSLGSLQSDDKQCIAGKQAYFAQCCDLSSPIFLPDSVASNSTSGDINNTSSSDKGNLIQSYGGSNLEEEKNLTPSSFPSGASEMTSAPNGFWGDVNIWSGSGWNPPSSGKHAVISSTVRWVLFFTFSGFGVI